jgi:ankyrin repeat protein
MLNASAAADKQKNEKTAAAVPMAEQLRKKLELAKVVAPLIKSVQEMLISNDDMIKINLLKLASDERVDNIDLTFGPANQSLLFAAVVLGNLPLLQKILMQSPRIDLQDIDGNTVMHYAAVFGVDPQITQALLNAGATIDSRNNDKETPLLVAHLSWKCVRPDFYKKTMELIIDATVAKDRAYLQLRNNDGHSPLILATSVLNVALIELLIQYGASLQDVLHALAFANNIKPNIQTILAEEAEKLPLQKKEESINQILKMLIAEVARQHALQAAAGSTVTVAPSELDLKAVSSADSKDAADAQTEKPYIHTYSRAKLMELIKTRKIDVNQPLDPDDRARTVLCWAAFHNDLELAQCAMAHGFNELTMDDSSGENALTLAAYYADEHFLNFLLKYLPYDFANNDNETPLLCAVARNKTQNVRALARAITDPVKKRAYFNQNDDAQFTPLLASIYNNVPTMVQDVLLHGADPLLLDEHGNSMIFVARNVFKQNELLPTFAAPEEMEKNNREIICLLEAHVAAQHKVAKEAQQKMKRKLKAKSGKSKPIKLQPRGKSKHQPNAVGDATAAGVTIAAQQHLQDDTKHLAEFFGSISAGAMTSAFKQAEQQNNNESKAANAIAVNANLLEEQLALHELYKLEFEEAMKNGSTEKMIEMRSKYAALVKKLQQLKCPRIDFKPIYYEYYVPLMNKAKNLK